MTNILLIESSNNNLFLEYVSSTQIYERSGLLRIKLEFSRPLPCKKKEKSWAFEKLINAKSRLVNSIFIFNELN